MDWSSERYVRLYTRDTAAWKLAPWQAKAVLPLVMRKLDRAGRLDLGEEGIEALAAIIELPLEVVEPGVAYWLLPKRGTLRIDGTTLVAPKFVDAQECHASTALRAKVYRDRQKTSHHVTDTSQDVTVPSRNVTGRHAPSHAVTPIRSDPCCAVPDQISPPPSVVPLTGQARGHRPKKFKTHVPQSDAPAEEVNAWCGVNEIPLTHPEREKFLDYWRSNGKPMADWKATWRNWVRRAPEMSGPAPPRGKLQAVQPQPDSGPLWKAGKVL